VAVTDSVVLCGGADRIGEHFNDVAVYAVGSSLIACQPLTAGYTMPKMGGHVAVPVCSHGHTLSRHGEHQLISLLFGGINFVDERVFSDVFELAVFSDTASGSAGASRYTCLRATCSGVVPEGRTGHTLTPLPLVLLDGAHVSGAGDVSQLRCFLLFGGSSPVDGVMNDLHLLVAVPVGDCSKAAAPVPLSAGAAPAIALDGAGVEGCGTTGALTAAGCSDAPAVCPSVTAAPAARYHLHWHQLPTKGPAPTPREMHSNFIRPGVQHGPEGGAGTAATEAQAPLVKLAAAFQEGVRAALNAAATSCGGGADSSSGVSVASPGIVVAAASPASTAAATPLDGCEPPALVVLGGRNEDGGPQMDGCVLDLSTLTWQRPARIPHAIISAASGTIPAGVPSRAQGSGVGAAATAVIDSGAGDVPLTIGEGTTTAAVPILAAPAAAPCCACAGGFQHFVYGGWDGAAGLSNKLLVLDTRPSTLTVPCAVQGSPASRAAACAEGSGERSGLPCAPTYVAVLPAGLSCTSTATSADHQAPGSNDTAPAAVDPSLPLDVAAWFRSWETLPLRSSPAPPARFAAAAALVQTTGPQAAAASPPAAPTASAGGIEDAPRAASISATWSLLVFGGMTAERDLSETLRIDLPPARC
jgi:hypothetical protein